MTPERAEFMHEIARLRLPLAVAGIVLLLVPVLVQIVRPEPRPRRWRETRRAR